MCVYMLLDAQTWNIYHDCLTKMRKFEEKRKKKRKKGNERKLYMGEWTQALTRIKHARTFSGSYQLCERKIHNSCCIQTHIAKSINSVANNRWSFLMRTFGEQWQASMYAFLLCRAQTHTYKHTHTQRLLFCINQKGFGWNILQGKIGNTAIIIVCRVSVVVCRSE